MYRQTYLCLILILLISTESLFSQESASKERAILFYNTENFFDTANDSLTSDDDFTPDGAMHWNSTKYYRKINNISKVIFDSNGWNTPFLVGLCEIENDKVLRDLIYVGGLKNLHYQYIHFDSPDPRGIDVALLYNSKVFKPLYSKPISITTPTISLKTRDILYTCGIADKTDTLHIFVNHFPSRRGGQQESESKRIAVAQILHQAIDSILTASPKAKIFAMGDFNDSPTDLAIANVLLKSFSLKDSLIALAAPLADLGIGSHKFDGEWNMIDQMFENLNFANSILSGDSLSLNGFSPVNLPYLTDIDEVNLGHKLVRTYQGPRYEGGYSDHLPVIFKYRYKE